jgi:uncharacterized secreted protein with C-terminal beta-propeller domain
VAEGCDNYSHIHRFSLGDADGRVRYAKSGEIKGIVSDSFWMSEYDGYLRVVSQENFWSSGSKGSSLSVLKINSDSQVMPVASTISGIAPGERVYAARMFGPKGYVVTFKQVDPLFTLDLSQPMSPKIVGELKINGYSSYIHPLGQDALLTIGEDADDDGRTTGLQLQIFDVSNMKDPKQIHKEVIERSENSYSSSEAMYDHHAFTYHAGSGLLAIPINMYHWNGWEGKDFSGLLVYKATRNDGFKYLGGIQHSDLRPDLSSYRWWKSLRRSVFMFKTANVYDKDAYVYSISTDGIKANDANSPKTEFSRTEF